MDARHILGFPGIDFGVVLGFSTKLTSFQSSSTSIIPNSEASSIGIGIAEIDKSAHFSLWKSSIWETSIL